MGNEVRFANKATEDKGSHMLRIPKKLRPPTPGEILLKDYLEPLGITQLAFAERIRVTPARLNEVIKGKRAITPDTALRLERVLGTSAGSWLNMQLILDLYDAQHSAGAKIYARLKPLTQKPKALGYSRKNGKRSVMGLREAP
jgi:addiction module HigA family antidote